MKNTVSRFRNKCDHKIWRYKSLERAYIEVTIEKKKNIALIAHDSKKSELVKWCMDNKEIL